MMMKTFVYFTLLASLLSIAVSGADVEPFLRLLRARKDNNEVGVERNIGSKSGSLAQQFKGVKVIDIGGGGSNTGSSSGGDIDSGCIGAKCNEAESFDSDEALKQKKKEAQELEKKKKEEYARLKKLQEQSKHPGPCCCECDSLPCECECAWPRYQIWMPHGFEIVDLTGNMMKYQTKVMHEKMKLDKKGGIKSSDSSRRLSSSESAEELAIEKVIEEKIVEEKIVDPFLSCCCLCESFPCDCSYGAGPKQTLGAKAVTFEPTEFPTTPPTLEPSTASPSNVAFSALQDVPTFAPSLQEDESPTPAPSLQGGDEEVPTPAPSLQGEDVPTPAPSAE